MRRDGYFEFDESSDEATLPSQRDTRLPSQKKEAPRRREPRQRPSQVRKPIKKTQGNKKSYKWLWIIAAVIIIYLFYTPMLKFFLGLLEANPTLYSYYLYVEAQITNETLKGLFFITILGTLFFLALPSEAVFIYFLSSTNHQIYLIILSALIGNIIGMSINYGFGRLVGQKPLKWLFKKNFENYKEKVQKYGGWVLLIGNIIPGPIEVLAIFFGGFKFKYPVYVYLVLIGRLIKYLILLVAFIFFWESIIVYYEYTIQGFEILTAELSSIV